MKELLEKIQTTITSFNTDSLSQLEKNNKAAGVRARKTSLELEKLMKQFRKTSIAESK